MSWRCLKCRAENWMSNVACTACGQAALPLQRQQFSDWQNRQQTVGSATTAKGHKGGSGVSSDQVCSLPDAYNPGVQMGKGVVPPFAQHVDPDLTEGRRGVCHILTRKRTRIFLVPPKGPALKQSSSPPIANALPPQRAHSQPPLHAESNRGHAGVIQPSPITPQVFVALPPGQQNQVMGDLLFQRVHLIYPDLAVILARVLLEDD